jgi:ABC-type sugar transport system ATPase subunit
MAEYILEAKGIVKTFPGVRAVDNVDLNIARGEVHGLVGENGAGKTTLISILGGIYRPDGGEIRVAGQRVALNSPQEAARAGIGVVHQELSLVPNLTVAENIFFNRQPVGLLGAVNGRKLHEQTRQMLTLFHSEDIHPATLVKHLPMAKQQVVEILKAMALEPKVLILDEPTSSLTDRETEHLFATIRQMKRNGTSVVFISHHLKELFEVCDTVTILKDGKLVCEAEVKSIDENFLVRNMVGREILDIYGYERCCKDEPPMFAARNISRRGYFRNISFSVRRGEIVGFYGLVGSGRTEVGRAIFGAEPVDSGEIHLDGSKLEIKSPTQAIRTGIGYLTEDRKLQGLYLSKSLRDNVVSNHLADFVVGATLNDRRMEGFAERCVHDFSIMTPGIEQIVGHLSGGNQQKVLVSTWFGIKPKLLIADEPTRGVDVGARSDIYRFLRRLAREGTGIMMISSDLLEVLGVSDRIIVMKEGEVVGELDREQANEQKVVALATGVVAARDVGGQLL